jgi:hypothetical protein
MSGMLSNIVVINYNKATLIYIYIYMYIYIHIYIHINIYIYVGQQNTEMAICCLVTKYVSYLLSSNNQMLICELFMGVLQKASLFWKCVKPFSVDVVSQAWITKPFCAWPWLLA